MLCAVEKMVKEIEELDGLRALRLEGNTIGLEAAQTIAKALEKKSELQVHVPDHVHVPKHSLKHEFSTELKGSRKKKKQC